MSRITRTAVFLALLGCLVLSGSAPAAPTVVTLERAVLPGGGGSIGSAPRSVHGSIGQAVVGTAEAGPYRIGAGFWAASPIYRAHLPLVWHGGAH